MRGERGWTQTYIGLLNKSLELFSGLLNIQETAEKSLSSVKHCILQRLSERLMIISLTRACSGVSGRARGTEMIRSDEGEQSFMYINLS